MANDYKKSIQEIGVEIDTLKGKIEALNKVIANTASNLSKVKTSGTPGGVSDTSDQQKAAIEKLNKELQKQAKLIDQLRQKTKEFDMTNVKTLKGSKQMIALEKQKQKELKKTSESMRKGAKETASLTVRVKSFFKTLVLFDVARRAVDAFWKSFKKGYETLKALDSIRLQFQYIVNDINETTQTMAFLTRISSAYGAELVNLSERYIKFRTAAKQSNLSAIDSRNIFESVTKAAGVLGLKTHELQGIYLALEQMLSKGKVTTEELRRQLGERLPGAMGIMADAVGVSVSELDKMLKKGEVLSAEVLPKFAEALEKAYGIEQVESVETLQAATVRFDNAFTTMVGHIESGSGRVSKAFIAMYELGKFAIESLGEAFLTDVQIGKFYKKAGIEKGVEDAERQYAMFVKQYGENSTKLRTAVGQDIQQMIFGMKDLEKNVEDTYKTLKQERLQSGLLGIFNIDDLNKAEVEFKSASEKYGKAMGVIRGYNQLLLASNKKVDESTTKEDGKTPYYLAYYDPESIKGLKLAIKYNNELISVSKDRSYIESLQEQNKQFQIAIDYLETGTFKFHEFNKILNKNTKDTKNNANALKQANDERLRLESGLEAALIDLTSASVDSILTMRLDAIDEEMEKIRDRYDLQRELAESEIQDEESKQERLRQIDKEQELAEKKLLKEQEKAEKKAFIIQQAISIADIVRSTALGIALATANYSSNPITAPLLPGIIGLIKGTAALQIATVVAQTIPEFKDGVDNFGGGLAILGDGGKSEVGVLPSGEAFTTPSKDTLYNLPRGTKVFPSHEEFVNENQKMKDMIYSASLMASVDYANPKKAFDKSFEKSLKKAVINSLSGISIHNHSDKVGKSVREALDDYVVESKFL